MIKFLAERFHFGRRVDGPIEHCGEPISRQVLAEKDSEKDAGTL
jgi:hypothetical protein